MLLEGCDLGFALAEEGFVGPVVFEEPGVC